MKIKTDFITNSSSCCFLISSPKKITKKHFYDEDFRGTFNDYKSMGTIDQLIEYVDMEPCDWIKKAMGPVRFYGATKQWYEKAKTIIEEGNYITSAHVERDPDDLEHFEGILEKTDCKVIEKEYD